MSASDLDFLVCDAGAMIWHLVEGDGGEGQAAGPGVEGRASVPVSLVCDEEYERHVDFRWDAHVVKQVGSCGEAAMKLNGT